MLFVQAQGNAGAAGHAQGVYVGGFGIGVISDVHGIREERTMLEAA